jgi:NADH-quinone oxidoreductase chain I
LHITASHLFREPITIQYPDRTGDRTVADLLPDRYRGFLQVDMDICTACKLCEKDCPIDCIEIIIEKNEETKQRYMTIFDIDLAKCMWCGLCTEPCPTGAIHFTPEFERSTTNLRDLLFHYIPEGGQVIPYKVPRKKKDKTEQADSAEEES